MLFQHFIWDFDGTLFNTYPHMTKSMHLALQECGVEVPYEEVAVWIKRSVSQALDHFKNTYSIGDELEQRYKQNELNSGSGQIYPYDLAEETCKKICRLGGYNYLYTHRNASAKFYLEYYNMDGYFRDMVLQENGFPSKPAPDAILHLIKKFNIDKCKAIIIGDRDIDIQAGLNAGISACLFDPDDFYINFKVQNRVHNMMEFCNFYLR